MSRLYRFEILQSGQWVAIVSFKAVSDLRAFERAKFTCPGETYRLIADEKVVPFTERPIHKCPRCGHLYRVTFVGGRPLDDEEVTCGICCFVDSGAKPYETVF